MTDAVFSHLSSLNLTGNPFPLSPDAANHFVSDALAVSMVEILHTIKARKGFILVTGEVGVGKSTLSRRLMAELHEESVETALILNTFLQGESLLEAINEDFGICENGKNIHECLKLLNAFLLKRHAEGINCVVMIDDAQNLDPVSLELVRQLSNLETGQEKLVQILLISQPEISDVLNRHDLRQLKSRIALHIHLMDFSLEESYQYINFRLKRFGGGITLTRGALNLLQKASQGYPRIINKLMDRCLYGLVASNKREVSGPLMRTSINELHLSEHIGFPFVKVLSVALGLGVMVFMTSPLWSENALIAKALSGLPNDNVQQLVETRLESEKISMQQKTAVEHRDSSHAVVVSLSAQSERDVNSSTDLRVISVVEKVDAQKVAVEQQNSSSTAVPMLEKPVASVADLKNVTAPQQTTQRETELALEAEKAPPLPSLPLNNDIEKNKVEKVISSSISLRDKEATPVVNAAITRSGFATPVTLASVAQSVEPPQLALLPITPAQKLVPIKKQVLKGINVEIFKSTSISMVSSDMRFGTTSIYTRNIQRFLKQMGHYHGHVDGIVGNRTVVALAEFQKSQGFSPTGSVDDATIHAMIDLVDQKNEIFSNSNKNYSH